ncbi:hypothetical protein GF373_04430, partial [bacterium]|nr:hypothetical protein [bacterium]
MFRPIKSPRVFFLAVFCLSFFPLAGLGVSYHVDSFQVQDGLPTNIVKAIAQDQNGIVWIATDEGVSVYDGTGFENFLFDLPSNYVKSVKAISGNRLLIITDFGISVYENKRFTVLLPGHDKQRDGYVFYPKAVYEDSEGALWISEPNAIVRWDHGDFQRFYFDEKHRADSYERSFHVFEDASNQLIVISQRGGVFVFSRSQNAFLEVPVTFTDPSIDPATFRVDESLLLP